MKINKGSICPFIRIKTPIDIDFFSEHEKMIKESGYVWFCRFGKNNMKKYILESYAPYLLIKDVGTKNEVVFIAKYDEITEKYPYGQLVPSYYHTIKQEPTMWFKVKEIERVKFSTVASFFTGNTSGVDLKKILRSMCPAFYVKCKSDLEV